VQTVDHDKPRPQDIEKLNTESQILEVLEKGKMRWKELKAAIPISTRTLADRLKELQRNGFIRRIIDEQVYPPAVSYEKTSAAALKQAPVGMHGQILRLFAEFLAEERDMRKIVTAQLERDASSEDIVIASIEGYVVDFLFTLRFCLENSRMSPYVVFFHKELYGARLEHLIEAWTKKPELAKAVCDEQERLMQDRKEESNKAFEKWSEPFSNKALAKAIIRLYVQKVALGDEKGNAYEFLKRLIENQGLQKELHLESGIQIDVQELKRIHKEPGWKNLNAKSPA